MTDCFVNIEGVESSFSKSQVSNYTSSTDKPQGDLKNISQAGSDVSNSGDSGGGFLSKIFGNSSDGSKSGSGGSDKKVGDYITPDTISATENLLGQGLSMIHKNPMKASCGHKPWFGKAKKAAWQACMANITNPPSSSRDVVPPPSDSGKNTSLITGIIVASIIILIIVIVIIKMRKK